jgi:hypothetical protein
MKCSNRLVTALATTALFLCAIQCKAEEGPAWGSKDFDKLADGPVWEPRNLGPTSGGFSPSHAPQASKVKTARASTTTSSAQRAIGQKDIDLNNVRMQLEEMIAKGFIGQRTDKAYLAVSGSKIKVRLSSGVMGPEHDAEELLREGLAKASAAH